MAYARKLYDATDFDLFYYHDDWGSKQSLFISPDTWREFIKPQYERSYKYMKDHGVIIMHHADSFMEPIIEDMVDLGIDIWQGTLPQNAACIHFAVGCTGNHRENIKRAGKNLIFGISCGKLMKLLYKEVKRCRHFLW